MRTKELKDKVFHQHQELEKKLNTKEDGEEIKTTSHSLVVDEGSKSQSSSNKREIKRQAKAILDNWPLKPDGRYVAPEMPLYWDMRRQACILPHLLPFMALSSDTGVT